MDLWGGGAPENNAPVRVKEKFLGFTLAEVLITLGIIGIVAAMTISGLIKNYQERQFKTAYKKVYSELSQAFQEALLNEEFTRTTKFSAEATTEEFKILKSKFKVMLDCGSEDIYRCWKKGDTLCGGSCQSGNSADGIDMDNGYPYDNNSSCFIDAGGQSWCTYNYSENIFLVDTNGRANPNRFGRDRWIFTFADINNSRADYAKDYKKVIPYINEDVLTQKWYCKRPPCYYQSWLLK